MLTSRHVNFLRGILRKEIDWRQGTLDNFQPRPGQSQAQAQDARHKMQLHMKLAQETMKELDRLSERALAHSRIQNDE